jgi:mannose-6-phosphate isomerase-like protein (cupin superfamily)
MGREITIRPWGFYDVLHVEKGYQIKRIHVEQNCRLSLQSHKYRAEHWYVTQGIGLIEVAGASFQIEKGDTVTIGVGEVHRIEGVGETGVTFFEIQAGDYLGEDDITRYEDDYGRAD